MKSCQIGAIITMLLLNALTLELVSAPAGRAARARADVVEGLLRLRADPVVDAVEN